MKQKLKNAVDKSVNWVKKHKAKIITGIAGTGLIVLGVKTAKSISNKKPEALDYQSEDYGRDCIMKFYVDDNSQEVLGEVPCTEDYAKTMSEIMDDADNK